MNSEDSNISTGNGNVKDAEVEIEVAAIKTAGDNVKKTGAQKKREKKQKKLQQEQDDAAGDVPGESTQNDIEPVSDKIEPEDGGKSEADKKKKKKPGAKKVETKEAPRKGPSNKQIEAIKEALRKAKEEEEALLREEEEKERQLEEAETARLEKLRLEQERKDRKKQKEKERKERLKAEGKLLTKEEKQKRQRAQAMLEALKAQGVQVPDASDKIKARLGTRIRKKNQLQSQKSSEEITSEGNETSGTGIAKSDSLDAMQKEPERVKDAWDEECNEDVQSKRESESEPVKEIISPIAEKPVDDADQKNGSAQNENSENDDDGDDSGDSSSDEGNQKTEGATKKERALFRIMKRRDEHEKQRSVKNLRCPVVCVLGHVDTGKTKILDKLRRTNVQDGEAGGITQQIGATNVPIEALKESTRMVKNFNDLELKLPGLLIIDTPGHESFSNLRSRGSSLCDIAILVVDIMHGLEPQTIESLNLLKNKKTPFVVALNKIDRLYDWTSTAKTSKKDVRDVIKSQPKNTYAEFEKRANEVIVQFAEQGMNARLFDQNPDPKSYISMVPTSALTGEGMGNLMALIVELSQTMLAKRLMYSKELQATVLEVKAIPGLGTTIDVILINGSLREGETLIVAGTDGPIVTQIRSLLTPQPMKELRVKNTYIEYKEIKGAIGVKIAGKDLEKAIAGLNVCVAHHPDETEICREEVALELKSALNSIRLQERGVYVQASTLGSLEALLEFLKTSSIPYANIRIGPVVKKDVMKASIMLEHDSQYAVILAFDVKVERDAQEVADHLGVKIFKADIIYHLFDMFTAYREDLRAKKRDEFKHLAIFPCKIKILPQFIFNTRDPIVVGVVIEAGTLKEGTPLCVPNREFVDLGRVTSIEINHKQIDKATKGQEVCIKIEPNPGETPKLLGRHFEETDVLYSKISRESIDACKEYFRSDLQKSDWQLIVEMKKTFQIM